VSGTVTSIGGGASNSGNFYGIAIDNNNNAWAADYSTGNLFEVTASGAQFSSGTTFESTTNKNGGGGLTAPSLSTGSTSAHPIDIAFDANNDLFATLYGNGGTSPAGGSGCGTYTSGTKNIVTFPYLTGSSAYGAISYGSSGGSNQTFIAIDNGTQDTAGGAAIAGGPFVWWLAEASDSGERSSGHYGLLFQAATSTAAAGTTSPATIQGCNTTIGSISSTNATPTTKLPIYANGTDATDPFNNAFAVAFDASNNLWSTSQLPTDTNTTYTNSLTKITPNYGASVSSANFAAASSYVVYATGGELASGFKAQSLAVDGNGNVFAASNGTKAQVAAITNTGAALAPSTAFLGATYASTSDGTNYTGFTRPFASAATTVIDPSGNVWVPSGAATPATVPSSGNNNLTVASVPATNVVQIVGLAAPVQTPIAAAVTNHNLGSKP
jgi:hypothetical protein